MLLFLGRAWRMEIWQETFQRTRIVRELRFSPADGAVLSR